MTVETDALLRALAGGLVVSCQLDLGGDLPPGVADLVMALSAERGGAVGIRTNGTDSVRAIRSALDLPVIGLHKVTGPRRKIITPELAQAFALAEAGAHVVAIEYTAETASDDPARLLALLAEGITVLADVSTFEEGMSAWDAGVPAIATTLSGYTPHSLRPAHGGPDIALVERLAARGVRVVAEGRYATEGDVRAAFDAGATTVVVGGAITDPTQLTRRLVGATPGKQATTRSAG